jgi:hypothetical protein
MCATELASVLAGEPFSDRPRAVCPVIAGCVRAAEDALAVRSRLWRWRRARPRAGERTPIRRRVA